ncbi:MAG: hypothetical protein EOM73_07265 [Bacteroidia bacterium]|nr:hypothetical protein [Bacteroidia bacterium]
MKNLLYRLLFVALVLFQFSLSAQNGKSFTFVQMTDTQLGFGGYEHDLQMFEQAVKQINELNPDFVVICGDLVNQPDAASYADFLRVKKKFDMPCYCVAGNHDVQRVPTDTSLTCYRKTIGKDYYSFRHKGYTFIVTSTQLWNEEVKNESEKHDQWFKKTLTAAGKRKSPVFVIGHSPVYISEVDEKPAYFNFPPEKRKEVLELFKANQAVAYLSGHAHKLILNDYEGVRLVSSEATSKNLDDRPLGFRVWDVSSGKASHRFVALEP